MTTRWEERRYPELEALAGRPVVAILPLGAIEAHGPHLPVGSDGWIAEAMAREGARQLQAGGVEAVVLPTVGYAPAPFAEDFAGTLSIRPATLTALVVDVGAAVRRRGITTFVLANSHFDPAQVAALRAAVAEMESRGDLRVVFPDLTRRALATQLTDEFRSGACHAGRYETSILLAERPELVDERRRANLAPVEISLSETIGKRQESFGAAGLEKAYCGDPAAASPEEGRDIVVRLGRILAEAVRSR